MRILQFKNYLFTNSEPFSFFLFRVLQFNWVDRIIFLSLLLFTSKVMKLSCLFNRLQLISSVLNILFQVFSFVNVCTIDPVSKRKLEANFESVFGWFTLLLELDFGWKRQQQLVVYSLKPAQNSDVATACNISIFSIKIARMFNGGRVKYSFYSVAFCIKVYTGTISCISI